MAEKTATELVTPISLVWWVSLVLAIRMWQTGERRATYMLFGMVLLTYVACTPITARYALGFLESRVPTTKLSIDFPLDTLVVLGGGTNEAPDGRAQFSLSGDRVGLAMQLYHQGLAKRMIVTGDAMKGLENASHNDPSIQSKRILMAMGVPAAAIEELSGSNTSEELRSLKARPDLWSGKRCGLLTSAFHMPRAIGLARKNGVDVLPILADYKIGDGPLGFRDFIPSARGAFLSDLAIREYLGTLIGR